MKLQLMSSHDILLQQQIIISVDVVTVVQDTLRVK